MNEYLNAVPKTMMYEKTKTVHAVIKLTARVWARLPTEARVFLIYQCTYMLTTLIPRPPARAYARVVRSRHAFGLVFGFGKFINGVHGIS